MMGKELPDYIEPIRVLSRYTDRLKAVGLTGSSMAGRLWEVRLPHAGVFQFLVEENDEPVLLQHASRLRGEGEYD